MEYCIMEFAGDSSPPGQMFWGQKFECLADAKMVAERLYWRHGVVKEYHIVVMPYENDGLDEEVLFQIGGDSIG